MLRVTRYRLLYAVELLGLALTVCKISKGAFRRLRRYNVRVFFPHTFLATIGSKFPSLGKFANLFEEKKSDFLGGKFFARTRVYFIYFLNIFYNPF